MDLNTCPICHGSGWIIDEQDDNEVKMCECLRIKQEHRLFRAAEFPERLFSREFEDFETMTPTQRHALNIAQEFVEIYPHHEYGLFFYGPTGVGKTFLATCVGKELLRKGVHVLFVDCPTFMLKMRNAATWSSKQTEYKILEPLFDAEVLILDDIGAHESHEFFQNMYLTIINYRYNHNKALIATMNYYERTGSRGEGLSSKDAFRENGAIRSKSRMGRTSVSAGQRNVPALPGLFVELNSKVSSRATSRLMEMCLFVYLESPDFRISVKQAGFQNVLHYSQHSEAESSDPGNSGTPVKKQPRSPALIDDEDDE